MDNWRLLGLESVLSSRPVGRKMGSSANSAGKADDLSFQQELDRQVNSQPLQLSGHAKERLYQRNIRLTREDLNQLGHAVDQIAAKGGRESLILYRNTAFVVSVANRTVITAMEPEKLRGHVFTQIDSTMIM